MSRWLASRAPYRGWSLDPESWRRARECVADRAAALASTLRPWQPLRWRGGWQASTLHLDDVSAIPFLVDISGVEEYQHRARLRAREGDLFVAVTPPAVGYERYCRRDLGLGAAEAFLAEPVDGPLEVAAACLAEPNRRRLVERVRARGALHLHPYMGIEAVWELAAVLGRDAAVPVEVLAPPPPVTWIANDKAQFEDLVEAILGRDWLVESRRSADPEELTRFALELAGRHERVGLKRLRCASAMGNRVVDAAELRERGPTAARALVDEFLERTEWPGDEELLVVAWESTDRSPSTQLWIPPVEVGAPRLDGIYDQILAGDEKVFVGSRPSALPKPTQRRLAEAALRVASGLQALGYVGRCSFDHLVIGDPEAEPTLRFTECNGRWGGTSTPMSLVDRLWPGQRPPYRAQDFVDSRLCGTTFEQLLDALDGRLLRPGQEPGDAVAGSTSGFLFYNVGPLEADGKLDVVAVASEQAVAERALAEELPRRLGL